MDWEQIYADLMPKIYNYFRYRFRDNPLAEDLTASTFEKAWRFRQNYNSELGKFESWVFGIARNLATDHLRKQGVKLVPLHDLDYLTSEESVEKIVTRQWAVATLEEALRHLSEREQELVALKYGGQLTNRAIASMTGLSESNVGTIMARAIQKLRSTLDNPLAIGDSLP